MASGQLVSIGGRIQILIVLFPPHHPISPPVSLWCPDARGLLASLPFDWYPALWLLLALQTFLSCWALIFLGSDIFVLQFLVFSLHLLLAQGFGKLGNYFM